MRRMVLTLLLILIAGLTADKVYAVETPARAAPVGIDAQTTTAASVSVTRHRNGELFFDIEDAIPRAIDRAARPRRVRVYWDDSLSRADDDLEAEKNLLLLYLDAVHPGIIDLVLFSNGVPQLTIIEAPQEAAQLGAILHGLRYQGSRSSHDVLDLELPPADACLYFSDGTVSLDPDDAGRTRCPLFTISSAADANRGLLRVLARRGAGAHLDLSTVSAEEAVLRLTGGTARVLAVTSSDGRDIEYALLPADAGRVRIIGRLPQSGGIVVTLAGGTKRTVTRSYSTKNARPRSDDGIGALWAVDRLHELAAKAEPDFERMAVVAKRYSVGDALLSE